MSAHVNIQELKRDGGSQEQYNRALAGVSTIKHSREIIVRALIMRARCPQVVPWREYVAREVPMVPLPRGVFFSFRIFRMQSRNFRSDCSNRGTR